MPQNYAHMYLENFMRYGNCKQLIDSTIWSLTVDTREHGSNRNESRHIVSLQVSGEHDKF